MAKGDTFVMQNDEQGAKVNFPPPLVYVAFTVLGIIFRYALFPIALSAHLSIYRWAGVAVLSMGLFLAISARILFSRTGQSPIPWKPSPELLLQGPYQFTRNPMYVGVALIQFGLGLALNNLWISILAPVSLLVVHFLAVLPEEKYLSEKFGDSYRAYTSKVRRYL
jgi:protein-S-isoprenylcysteine O-methyltransferase Ste14